MATNVQQATSNKAAAPKASPAPATAPAPAQATKAKANEDGKTVVVVAQALLRDPHSGNWFNPNVPTETILNGWAQSQITAGLLKEVKG